MHSNRNYCSEVHFQHKTPQAECCFMSLCSKTDSIGCNAYVVLYSAYNDQVIVHVVNYNRFLLL